MMTSLVSMLIGLAFLLLAWRSWQVTMLDATRDRLFDLRDGLRDTFAGRADGLHNRIYLELRELVNAHLRSTEDVRFVGFVWFARLLTPELVRHISRAIDARFVTDDPELAALVQQTRRAAARAMQKYMLCTSSLAMLLALTTCLPIACVAALRHGFAHLFRNVRRALVARLDNTVIGPDRFEWAAQLKAA